VKKNDRKKLAKILEAIDSARDELELFIGNTTLNDNEHSELDDAYSFLDQAHGAMFTHCPEE
jgi:hypothetical protein